MAKDTAWLKAWLDFSIAYNTVSSTRDDEDNVNLSPKKVQTQLSGERKKAGAHACLLTWVSQWKHKMAAASVLFPTYGNSAVIGVLWEECNIVLRIYTLHS